jgi:hypothetical protein
LSKDLAGQLAHSTAYVDNISGKRPFVAVRHKQPLPDIRRAGFATALQALLTGKVRVVNFRGTIVSIQHLSSTDTRCQGCTSKGGIMACARDVEIFDPSSMAKRDSILATLARYFARSFKTVKHPPAQHKEWDDLAPVRAAVGGEPRPRLHGLRKRSANYEARAGGVLLEARPQAQP